MGNFVTTIRVDKDGINTYKLTVKSPTDIYIYSHRTNSDLYNIKLPYCKLIKGKDIANINLVECTEKCYET